MFKHLLLFAVCFSLGCIAALATRTALHSPHQSVGESSAAGDSAPLVSNPLTPASPPVTPHEHSPAPSAPPSASPASAPATNPASVAEGTVNTVCAICGMDVDPSIPPATYQGKKIGFGCRMCPPKFAAQPDLYGPAALENRVIEK